MTIWIASLVAAVLLCQSVTQAQTQPNTAAEKSEKLTYVLVHGAWAGGWEWKNVGNKLEASGHKVYRPTLTGMGERVHLSNENIDINTHVSDVVNTILFEDLHDIVLMGHSYGGVVITGVIDRVPDRIKAAIYVDAFVPEDGESANAVVGRGGFADSKVAFFNPGGWPYGPDKKPPYGVPQPAKTFSTPLPLKNPDVKNVRTTYILTVDPGKKPEQDLFYKSYQRAQARGWATQIMEADHVPQTTRPDELVELLKKAPAAAKSTAESAKP